jgi:DNA-binding response OmpR family regulator
VIHRLTPKQAELLRVFMVHAGQTLTRKFLMATVWKTDYMGDTRTLDVHVRWLRERIEDDPSSPQYLRTVRGVGYRFGVPSEE